MLGNKEKNPKIHRLINLYEKAGRVSDANFRKRDWLNVTLLDKFPVLKERSSETNRKNRSFFRIDFIDGKITCCNRFHC
jgi:hypothetical protein